ncbi:homoserine dehydrogenase [soil metagenome]
MNIGLLGAGTVGMAVTRLLAGRDDVDASLAKVLVRDTGRARDPIPANLLTTDPDEVMDAAEVLIEVMGGTGLAGDLTVAALGRGKRVVTANKAVLAERWDELEPFLRQGKLYFEAAVMAGTPVIGPLTGAFRGSRPVELHAVLNGTCSYILGELEKGTRFDDALAEAQRLGYAEADPTLDIGGFDAAHKLNVLARLVFDPEVSWDSVKATTTGIERLTPETMQKALELGGRVLLLGSVYPEDGAWKTTVRPVFLPNVHPLASAASGRNALYFRGDAVGEILITGAGAGGLPTASGVFADLIAALDGRPGPSPLKRAGPVSSERVVKLEELR